MAVRWYFKVTRPVAILLAEYFRVCFPKQFHTYEAAFKAGIWEQADPGPFLGRAIVYKLQVKSHLDSLDGDGPAATFPMGSFVGGAMYWPDLEAKLRSVPFHPIWQSEIAHFDLVTDPDTFASILLRRYITP